MGWKMVMNNCRRCNEGCPLYNVVDKANWF